MALYWSPGSQSVGLSLWQSQNWPWMIGFTLFLHVNWCAALWIKLMFLKVWIHVLYFVLFALFTLKIRFPPFITSSVDLRLQRSSYFTDLHYVLYQLVPATYWRSQENSKALSFELLNCLYCHNRVLSSSYRPFIDFCSFNFFAPLWFMPFYLHLFTSESCVSMLSTPLPPNRSIECFLLIITKATEHKDGIRDSSNINKVVIITM